MYLLQKMLMIDMYNMKFEFFVGFIKHVSSYYYYSISIIIQIYGLKCYVTFFIFLDSFLILLKPYNDIINNKYSIHTYIHIDIIYKNTIYILYRKVKLRHINK